MAELPLKENVLELPPLCENGSCNHDLVMLIGQMFPYMGYWKGHMFWVTQSSNGDKDTSQHGFTRISVKYLKLSRVGMR